MPRTRDWRKARKPIRVDELTERILAPVRAVADSSMLAQTVWPSRFYGRHFNGTASLVVHMAGVLARYDGRPQGAAEAADPLLTVLPRSHIPHAGEAFDLY